MNRSRRWIAALAVTLLAAAGAGAALNSNAAHTHGSLAGGSWYAVDN